jgi:hypothetical protein
MIWEIPWLVGLLFDGWVGWERMVAAKVLGEMSHRDSGEDAWRNESEGSKE